MTDTDTSKLRKRIAAALANDNVGSNELFELISETEQAARVANDAAAHARTGSEQLDADPTKSAHAISVAAIEARQLQRAAQQLHDMLPIALNHEQIARYATARDKLQPELDALEREAKKTISDSFDRLIELFGSIAAFKERARRELPDLPPNTATLRTFHPDLMRVLEKTQLFDFSGEQLWPPPSQNFAVAAVAAMSFPEFSHGMGNPIGPGWERPEVQAQFRADREREREQTADRYSRMSKESEERANREEKERFAASQRQRR